MKNMSKSVFVVDDDDAVRDSLRTLLELQSLSVSAFETCQDFLNADSAGAACLVLDIHLPGMSGFDLMEVLKREKRNLPTILITARCDNAIRDRARALGAVALLEKPINFNNLMGAIGRCMEQPDA
ncbi:MAG TPA: response regulator [Dongiaceae bacterium]|nr:response regulator [Dongiaceae bacterium]